MKPEKKPTYAHWVSVYRMSDFHKVFSVSCFNCKLKDQCESIYEKNNNCALSADLAKALRNVIQANVSAFTHTDFYVNSYFKFSNLTHILNKYRTHQHAK